MKLCHKESHKHLAYPILSSANNRSQNSLVGTTIILIKYSIVPQSMAWEVYAIAKGSDQNHPFIGTRPGNTDISQHNTPENQTFNHINHTRAVSDP